MLASALLLFGSSGVAETATTALAGAIYHYNDIANDAHGARTSVPSVVGPAATSSPTDRTRRSNAGFADFVAAKAGAGPVRVGQAGEDAVRGAYNIGDKVPIRVNGRGRIPDGLTPTTLSEVKNVGSSSYTRQIRDFEQYARDTGRTFDLFVRKGARLSGPLLDARAAGRINIREIP